MECRTLTHELEIGRYLQVEMVVCDGKGRMTNVIGSLGIRFGMSNLVDSESESL